MEMTDSNKQFDILFGHEQRKLNGINLKDLPQAKAIEVIRKSLKERTQKYSEPYNSLKGKHL